MNTVTVTVTVTVLNPFIIKITTNMIILPTYVPISAKVLSIKRDDLET